METLPKRRRTKISAYEFLSVLEGWPPSLDGLFLCHPIRRQVPAALRAFIDRVGAARHSPKAHS
jgi:hypothetical protein